MLRQISPRYDAHTIQRSTGSSTSLHHLSLQLKAMNVGDLKKRLAALEPEMAAEIQELKKRYQVRQDTDEAYEKRGSQFFSLFL